jgi:integrase
MTHAFRRAHLAWLKARSTSIAVQRKMMRPADVRTTMKIYRDVATKKMSAAGIKVVGTGGQDEGQTL